MPLSEPSPQTKLSSEALFAEDVPPVVSPPMIERRIQWVTLAVTAGAALAVGARSGWSVGVGVALGGLLAHLNFLWMRASLRAIVAATTAGGGKPSRFQMAKFFLRWVILGAVIWLAMQVASVAAVAIVCGLFALPLAVVVEACVQLWYGRPRAGRVTSGREPSV
ncbi:MAG: ATP synthase subunit I [Chloracidobacterium sp.]|nr:ATP synthase subunit I [Chloracidobacterium sp.]MDW8218400.1 ATP synthase subunit I [Acidobacteriota bacterium]